MKIIKRIIVVVILLGLIGIIGYRASVTYQARKKVMNQPAPEKIVPVEAVQPSRANIAEKIHASANIQADSEITIYSKVSGKIAKNLVQMASAVQPGQAVAVVNRDEVGYDYMPFEVKSDAKGVVVRILQNPGATVNPSMPLMTLVDIDTVKAVAAVDEKKIRFIKLDQAARVNVEAYPGETFAARVTNISPVCNLVNRTVEVELSIPNASHRVKPGMYAEVEWIASQRSALVVPIAFGRRARRAEVCFPGGRRSGFNQSGDRGRRRRRCHGDPLRAQGRRAGRHDRGRAAQRQGQDQGRRAQVIS